MPDLIKTLLDLTDIMIKWILRMIPPFVAIISLLVAYYYYKLNKESFKLNDKNYFYHRGCKKINKECGFKLSKNILKCPNWICNKSEKYQNYYCFDGEKCNKKKVNVKMCKNTCGYNQIGYTPNKIYTSEDECLKNLAYKKYNKEECLTKYLQSGNYKCPLCKKSLIDMTSMWEQIENYVKLCSMPEEFKNHKVKIFCNDCEKKSITKYHFTYNQCQECQGWNTDILETIID